MLKREHVTLVLSICVFLIGVSLRYQFIVVDNRPSDPANILGDADWYVYQAVNIFRPDFVPTMYDTLFPPGAPIYFAFLRWVDPSMRLLDTVQWLLACLVPIILGYTAHRLYGRTSALYVLAVSSLYFPFWEYFGYFISEGPFLFSMLLAFLLLILSLQAQTKNAALLWGGLAGLMLGVSAACKSCVLLSALLVFAALIFCRRKLKFRLWPSVVAAAIGLTVVLVPMSIRATRLNEGHFLLIANDAPRSFLLGHQGRAGLTWWIDSARNFKMNFSYPGASQHNYLEVKTYPFGPYEAWPNYRAGWQWIKEQPGEAVLLSFEHVFDMFAIALPWPGYFRPYVGWVIFFNEVFLVLILFPAVIHLLRHHRRLYQADPNYVGDLLLVAAAGSIYLLAFFFLGEGRYRICYDGFLILLASRAFFPEKCDKSFLCETMR